MVLDNSQTKATRLKTTIAPISDRDRYENSSRRRNRSRCQTKVAKRPGDREREVGRNTRRVQDTRCSNLVCDSRGRSEHQPRQSSTSSWGNIIAARIRKAAQYPPSFDRSSSSDQIVV